jgi:hypothetical protein
MTLLTLLVLSLFILTAETSRAESVTAPKPTIRAVIHDARTQITTERTTARQDIQGIRENARMGSTTASTTRADIRGDIQNRHDQASTTINKIKDDRNRQIKEALATVFNRLTVATDRLDKIVTRLESRMQKLKDAGADITKEKVLVDNAKELISKARTDIANTSASAGTITTATSPTEQFTKTKTQVTAIQDSLKKAQKELTDATIMLSKEHRGNTTQATTSSTTSN